MKLKTLALTAAVAATGVASLLGAPHAQAQTAEQFIPLLVYRTGQFAPLGIPWADGKQDYLKLVNARDGGVNGVKLTYEECETAYDAAKGRVNWSSRLREDHRLMAAAEKLIKSAGGGNRVSVKNARMGMPMVSILAGAGTNSHVLGDTVTQARHYGATVMLAEKYGLPLPPNLHRSMVMTLI